jgi:hypothetical protein
VLEAFTGVFHLGLNTVPVGIIHALECGPATRRAPWPAFKNNARRTGSQWYPSVLADDRGELTHYPPVFTDDRWELARYASVLTDDRWELPHYASVLTDDRWELAHYPSVLTDDR